MDDGRSIGNMILQMREEQGISQKALCEGICSQKMMSRYERWSTIPDRLSLNLILQRLGKSPEHFITILTQQEFVYLRWKMNLLEAMKLENIEKMKELLSNSEAFDRSCHERLQWQFQHYMSGYLEKKADKMKAAIQQTLPTYKKEVDRASCVSAMEMSMILLYLRVKGRNSETLKELKSCLYYMELYFSEEVMLNIYPAAICEYCEYQGIDKLERIVYCRKAIKLLTQHGRICELPILLDMISRDMEQINPVESKKYQNQLRALHDIYYEQKMVFRKAWEIKDICQEAYILNEVLKTYRREAGYSREDTSNGICDVISYGKVESGSRGIKQSNYEELAKRLKIPYGKYSMVIVTNDYDCLVLSRKIKCASKRHAWDEMQRYVDELKKRLDRSEKLNQQFIIMCENPIKLELGKKTIKGFRETAIQALQITIPKWHEEYGTHFYSDTELRLVNQIAVSYYKEKAYKKGGKIIENIWKMIETNRINMTTRTDVILLLLSTWKNILADSERYQEAVTICDEGIRVALKSEQSDKLDTFVHEKGWIAERMLDNKKVTKEKCLNYFMQAFYMSELFGKKKNEMILRNYITDIYGLSLD